MDKVFAARLAAIDVSKVFVYDIDRVDASALPYLAEQFDVLGYNGFLLATTDQQKRDVIKRAIELHRYKGTVWAVKEALKTIGYVGVQVVEHSGTHWATFKIILASGATLTNNSAADIIRMVTAFKNVRSHLDDITFNVSVTDTLTFTDRAQMVDSVLAFDALYFTGVLRHDGTGMRDGQYNYSGDRDVARFF